MKNNVEKSLCGNFAARHPLFASIRGRLFLLLLSVLIPVVLVQIVYLYIRFDERVQSQSSANLEVSRAVAATFSAFVKDILHQELAIGGNLTVRPLLSAAEMNRVLELNKKEFPAVHSFIWLDPHGRVAASGPGSAVDMELIDRDYVHRFMSGMGWAVGDLILSRAAGKPIFTVSRAIRGENGNLLGILVAAIQPEKLRDIISIHLPRDEAITIIDNHGRAVYREPKREWNWQDRKLLKSQPAIRQALEGREVSGVFPCCSGSGEERIVAIVPISSIGWAASVGRSKESVMTPIISQLLHEAVIFVLIMAAVLLGAFLLSEGISSSIRRLLEHTLALGGGYRKEPIEENGPAELKGLAAAFNVMAEKVDAREKALRAAQERLISVFEAIPACLYLQAPDYSIRFANRTFLETFGDPVGKYCYEVLRHRGAPCENCDLLCTIDTQTPRQWEWIDPDGKCYSIHSHPFTDSEGAPLVLKLAVDISERKRAWNAFRESESRYSELVRNANSAIIRLNKDGIITFFNEYAQAFFGYREEEVIGRHMGILLPEKQSDGADLIALVQDIMSRPGRCVNNTNENIRRDGSRAWMAWTNKPILDESGKVTGILSVGIDITERKKAEEALVESRQQLRSLSAKLLSAHEEERRRIAGELHDSLGSSLTAIKVGIENARIRLDRNESGPELLDAPIAMTQLAIDEVRKIMAELRPLVLDDFGIIAALNWFFRQYRTTYPRVHVEVEIGIEEQDIPEELRIVIFRITQEAFNNIAKYSRAEYVDFSLVKQHGDVQLIIEDNGDGFDLEAVLSKVGERQGLGLTSMKERAELSGGSFTIRSVPGTGTTLSAKWPLGAHPSSAIN